METNFKDKNSVAQMFCLLACPISQFCDDFCNILSWYIWRKQKNIIQIGEFIMM